MKCYTPNCTFRQTLIAGTLIGVTALPYVASAEDYYRNRANQPEIQLNVIRANRRDVATQPSSGWPLTLELTANENALEGVGARSLNGLEFFPRTNRTGFLIFDNPDNCPSFIDEFAQTQFVFTGGDDGGEPLPGCELSTPIPWARDERALEFTPGVSAVDNDPAAPEETGPQIRVFDDEFASGSALEEFGPNLGSTEDDVSWGAHRRIPGLVIVADTGPSIVLEQETGLRSTQLQCRNSAGFLTSVGLQLNDSRDATSVRVHMNVPAELYSPVLAADRNVTQGGFCEGGRIERLDGGPLECNTSSSTPETLDPPENFNDPVTLRAFVVNLGGGSPIEPLDVITDLNGDNRCDIRDARLAGYSTLSRQRTFRVSQLHEAVIGLVTDFDGNGDAGGLVAPAGRGSVRFPPR